MLGSFHPKPVPCLHHISIKTHYPTTNGMKINTLIHSRVFQRMCQVVKALTKAKSMLIQMLNQSKTYYISDIVKKRRKNKNKNKKPRISVMFNTKHACSNSTKKESKDVTDDSEISRYIQWFEQELSESSTCDGDVDKIDQLADKFIANFHEKFRLEKQDSYRRYQEMLARSI